MSIQKIIEKLEPLPMDKHITSFVSTDSAGRIKIQYYFNNASGHFYARVYFGKKAQGPPGHVHGGAVSSVLDEAMGAAAWMNGYTAMTAKLEINFFKALKLGEEFFVEAWVEKPYDNKIELKGKIISNNNKVFAESTGLFILKSKDYFLAMGEMPQEMFKKIKD